MNVEIWTKLIDGVEVSVKVIGKKIGKDMYKIIKNSYLDLDDSTAIWEFFPGDVVVCKKKGGELFAQSLVNSIIKDREVYSMIFLVVSKNGEISDDDIEKFRPEIKKLKESTDIKQKLHPVIKTWLKKVK
ncbi:hypothetical protein JW978_02275 [Candidatus Dojkabacteria bacterium]|nr:hypothetical protein [Candidatus Dojkabacteria bacterium]